MEPTLHDHLLTKAIEAEIARLGDPRLVALAPPVDSEESHSILAQYLERLIATRLAFHRSCLFPLQGDRWTLIRQQSITSQHVAKVL
jgi:hypothetical protein